MNDLPDLRGAVGLSVRQKRQDHFPAAAPALLFPRFRHTVRGNGQRGLDHLARLHLVPPHLRRDHEAEGLCQRAVAGIRHLPAQVQHMRQNGRILFQGADDIPDFFRLQVACFCQGQDNPVHFPIPERHAHPLSGGQRHVIRYPVGKCAVHGFMHNVHNHLREHVIPPSQTIPE